MPLLALAATGPASAADEGGSLAARIDSLSAEVRALREAKPAASPLRFSGLVQARWETAETSADTIRVSGSETATANRNRFTIRRARLKAAYEDPARGRGVVYFNAGDTRGVELLEAYVSVHDPWTPDRAHTLTLGQMNVPFGFDLEYSSSSQELLERSQAERTLFPGERDRGVTLESRWASGVTTTLGLFNGTTISEDPRFVATDPNGDKAAVARVRVKRGAFSAALSGYAARGAVPLTGPDAAHDKTRIGADVQAGYAIARLGKGELHAEWFAGRQVNPDSVKALTLTAGGATLPVANADLDHLATDFAGGYVTWVQGFATHLQFAARWDTWDPNADVDHDEFQRVSLALHGHHGKNIRASVLYEIPHTARPAPGGGFEDPHDNRWTVQIQHKL
jgi:hypothetical protein